MTESPTADPAAAAPALAAAPPKRQPGRLREWFWSSKAMAELRRRQQAEAASVALFDQRSRLAADLADSLLDAPEPVASGRPEGPACELYRQSIYWMLLALDAKHAQAAAGFAFQRAGTSSDELLALWARTATAANVEWAALAPVERDFSQRTFVDFADLSAEEQVLAARRLRRAARALIAGSSPTGKEIERVWNRRMLRLGAIFALVLVAIGLASLLGSYREKQRDIALNRPWRASSLTSLGCKSPDQSCEGYRDYFFHTSEEDRPWIEIDLGSIRSIAGIRVDNRKDCCGDRAVPLVVEVSNDQNRYREVARRDEAFQSWKSEFEPVQARYVKLRGTRRTILHLARVRVLRP